MNCKFIDGVTERNFSRWFQWNLKTLALFQGSQSAPNKPPSVFRLKNQNDFVAKKDFWEKLWRTRAQNHLSKSGAKNELTGHFASHREHIFFALAAYANSVWIHSYFNRFLADQCEWPGLAIFLVVYLIYNFPCRGELGCHTTNENWFPRFIK